MLMNIPKVDEGRHEAGTEPTADALTTTDNRGDQAVMIEFLADLNRSLRARHRFTQRMLANLQRQFDSTLNLSLPRI